MIERIIELYRAIYHPDMEVYWDIDIHTLASKIDKMYSVKQCMHCEATVEYSSGVFTCKDCSK